MYKKQHKMFNCNKVYSKLSTIYKKNKYFCYIKSVSFGRLTVSQIKSFKQILSKNIKKTGRLVFSIYPNIPVTKKPIEVRMGKGKGNVDHYIYKIKPGAILCYIETLFVHNILKILNQAQIRLPLKTKICTTSII
jgi:large subunit ribosomal protein L16